ncbi:MAG: 5-formyltetrahydrofolate cyclo-ligase [Thermodesulfobacteriota bacterium]
MLGQLERKPLEKNWKTLLNKDDYRQNKSLSLAREGSFNIPDAKQNIRTVISDVRKKLSAAEIDEKSSTISDHIVELEAFKLAKSISLYSPILNEVRTSAIFKAAVGLKKEVYFPRVNSLSLDFYRIYDLNDLVQGSFGVLEPVPNKHKVNLEQVDLFILPGLAFDKSGNRLGFGKGFYDRALKNISENKKVGICYDIQLLSSIPTDEHDSRVGTIITEQGIVFSRRKLGGK